LVRSGIVLLCCNRDTNDDMKKYVGLSAKFNNSIRHENMSGRQQNITFKKIRWRYNSGSNDGKSFK